MIFPNTGHIHSSSMYDGDIQAGTGWTWQLTIDCQLHVIMYHYVVTDWSSALAGFLVSTHFGASPGQS